MKPSNLQRLSLVIAAIGLLVSIYLTYTHYTNTHVACPDTGIINCNAVLGSPYAYLLGIPLATLGLLYFIAYIVLLALRRYDDVLLWNGLGMGFVLYVWFLEYIVGHICIYCTAVHIVVILLLVISAYRYRLGLH